MNQTIGPSRPGLPTLAGRGAPRIQVLHLRALRWGLNLGPPQCSTIELRPFPCRAFVVSLAVHNSGTLQSSTLKIYFQELTHYLWRNVFHAAVPSDDAINLFGWQL